MKFNDLADVSLAKTEVLRERLARLKIDLGAVEELFSKGGGPGGQKTNKTSNRVSLRYLPLNLVVHCRRERRRSLNRFLALRELADRVEMIVSPETSARLKERERIRRQKDRRARRRSTRQPPGNNPGYFEL